VKAFAHYTGAATEEIRRRYGRVHDELSTRSGLLTSIGLDRRGRRDRDLAR
jgi:hypothetical protein